MNDLHAFVLTLSGPTNNPFELARVIVAARATLSWEQTEALHPTVAKYARRYCAVDRFVERVTSSLYTTCDVTGAVIAQWAREAKAEVHEAAERASKQGQAEEGKAEELRKLAARFLEEVQRPETVAYAAEPPVRTDDSNLGWLAVLGAEAEARIYGFRR